MDFKTIEKKWIEYWDKNNTFYTDISDFSKPKYYVLDMFPYPSGQGLHVGHPEGYTATDVVARMKRMQGYNVLHPMGFDSFGLPAEQYAINTGNHPDTFTNKNIESFIRQLKMCGFSYDWSKCISTSDPSYYKWTQWLFKQLVIDKYAKNILTPVNWCEELGTVLANDEIIDGKSERGGFPVVRKNMRQWVIEIPKYADKLLTGLDNLDWPESSKTTQINWIGKSNGALIDFKVLDSNKTFTVFTTRADTLFGATYCVLAPEHPLVNEIVSQEQSKQVVEYQKVSSSKSDMERTELNKNKTGVFTGAYAINPVNNEKLPIYISDYVLISYGMGAIMAVPAHDDRDYEFAKKFGLPIIPVIDGGDITNCAYTGDGLHINSQFLNGLNKTDAINEMIKWLQKNKCGKSTTTFKLRDWIFARQRYWGEPIPVLYDKDNNISLLDDSELPLILPELDDYKGKNGLPPLENATTWKFVHKNGETFKRETTTMPGSAASSWYFMRYIDAHNNNEFANYDLLKHWMPVDMYVGGPEHLTGHLIYSRFFTNYLYDKGLCPVKEPFQKLVHQGMILGENGEKMSKSRGNVVNPDDVINKYGADTLRMYEMFMGDFRAVKPWNTSNIEGVYRFINKIDKMYFNSDIIKDGYNANVEKAYHQTVKKVTTDYESLNINTAISQMMIFINVVTKEEIFPTEYAKNFVKLLNPVCPFITEEIWQKKFNNTQSIAYATWPTFIESKTQENNIEYAIQLNNKIVDRVLVDAQLSNVDIEKIATTNDKVISALDGKNIVKVIVIRGRLVNIIAK